MKIGPKMFRAVYLEGNRRGRTWVPVRWCHQYVIVEDE